MYIFMYIYLFMYIYVYMFIHMYIYIHVYMYLFTQMCIDTHIYKYTCIHSHTHKYVYTSNLCIHIRAHTLTGCGVRGRRQCVSCASCRRGTSVRCSRSGLRCWILLVRRGGSIRIGWCSRCRKRKVPLGSLVEGAIDIHIYYICKYTHVYMHTLHM